jgi:hypothetical protein
MVGPVDSSETASQPLFPQKRPLMTTIQAGLELGPDSLSGWWPKFWPIQGSGPPLHGFQIVFQPRPLVLKLLNKCVYPFLGPPLPSPFLPELYLLEPLYQLPMSFFIHSQVEERPPAPNPPA